MVKKKLYLYKMLSDHVQSQDNNEDGVFIAKNGSLLGLDRNKWRGNEISEFEQSYPLKPFEVRQKKFDLLISYAKDIPLDIRRINFSNDLLEEEHDNLKNFLRSHDFQGLLEFIEEQRYEFGNDIEEITFVDNEFLANYPVTLSRNGVLTVDDLEEKIPEVISTIPIGVLSGTFLPTTIDEKRGN
jgi:hypothetical protein